MTTVMRFRCLEFKHVVFLTHCCSLEDEDGNYHMFFFFLFMCHWQLDLIWNTGFKYIYFYCMRNSVVKNKSLQSTSVFSFFSLFVAQTTEIKFDLILLHYFRVFEERKATNMSEFLIWYFWELYKMHILAYIIKWDFITSTKLYSQNRLKSHHSPVISFFFPSRPSVHL